MKKTASMAELSDEIASAEREVIDTIMKWAETEFGYDADAEKAAYKACLRLRRAREAASRKP